MAQNRPCQTGYWKLTPPYLPLQFALFLMHLSPKTRSHRSGNVQTFSPCLKSIIQRTLVNLRPISLTTVLSKILESFVFKWIYEIESAKIDKNQFGNIKGCSTTHLLHHRLSSSDTQRVIIRACMIDFSKGFDLIDHNIITTKLQLLGVPDILINWCADFLCQRYFSVKTGENKSAWKSTHAGVPQGTKLGPLLFLAMINGLTSDLPLYKYVDDVSIFECLNVSFPSFLRTELDKICNWSSTNNIKSMPQNLKSYASVSLSMSPQVQPLTVDGHVIDLVTHFKLLGLYISSQLRSLGPIMYIISVPRRAKDSMLFVP